MLSIGLAPGLTNLLAAHAHRLLDEVTELDIFIMLGLGDRHGKAAMEWTVDHLCTRYDVTQDFPQGVYRIEQLFKWKQMQAWLPKEADLQVSVSESPR